MIENTGLFTLAAMLMAMLLVINILVNAPERASNAGGFVLSMIVVLFGFLLYNSLSPPSEYLLHLVSVIQQHH